MTIDQLVALCRAECVTVPDPIAWTLARSREIDGGSDASVWQAIGEHHTGTCIARATAYAYGSHKLSEALAA